ncbi:MAG: extracellular solute-binding protein [Burkholderia gladioli]
MDNNLPALKILSWRGRWGLAFQETVLAPFTAETGIAVEPVHHIGLRLPAALRGALAQGARPTVDVVWSNTAPALRASRHGWCAPLTGIDALADLHARANLPEDGEPTIAQAYVVPYVLVYRRACYPDGPPRSWRALFDTRHAGKVVMYPGGNGFYPIAQQLGGGSVAEIPDRMAPCWSTVAELAPLLGRPDYSIGMETQLARGDIDLCLRALPNALAFMAAGLEVDWTVPEEGTTDTTDALWIPRGLAPEVEARARAFIAFALSPRVQQRWCEALGALPMNRLATPSPAIVSHPRLPRDADDHQAVLFVPESVKARFESHWESNFDALLASTPRASLTCQRAP